MEYIDIPFVICNLNKLINNINGDYISHFYEIKVKKTETNI